MITVMDRNDLSKTVPSPVVKVCFYSGAAGVSPAISALLETIEKGRRRLRIAGKLTG